MKKILGLMGVVGLLFAGCSSDDDILSSFHNDPNAVHITAEVGKASADGFTRSNPLGATEADQKKFNENDEISVKADGQDAVTYRFNGSEWIPQDSKFLKWESETMNFTAYYPASYTGGTITQPTAYPDEASLIAADYMIFTDYVKNPGDNSLTLTMQRKMARVVVEIVKFNDQYASGTTVNSVTINGVKAYKHDDGKFYALIKPCSNQADQEFLSLKVGEGNTETYTGIPALEAGKSYTYQLTVGKNKVVVTGITVADWTTGETLDGKAEHIPYVTFTAEAEQKFKMTTTGNYDLSGKFQYSVNEGKWENVVKDEEVTFGGTNGNLRLRGINKNGTATDDSNYSTITFTDDNVKVACTGDIRTLLDYKTYKTVDTSNARFCYLFIYCKVLTSAPQLPATTLASKCYSYMFSSCTSLESAPALPAKTLADSCYQSMFNLCKNLTSAPALLPATTLADQCYYYMFNGCTNLKSAPELSATTLAAYCCSYMFSDCKKLTSAPALSATTLADYCYYYMFNNCTSLESAPKLSATTLASNCYDSMFRNCTNLTSAPKLPATTLADDCYRMMFYGCSNLSSAPKLPATTLADYCYSMMFYGCSNLSSVTMLAPSDQISRSSFTNWLHNAGTTATSRTLIVKDKDAYEATKGQLPTEWQIGQCTVLAEDNSTITE